MGDRRARALSRVKEAVREDHLHVEVGAAAGNLFTIDPGGLQQPRLRKRNAIDQVHRQHPRRRKLGVGPRDMDGRIIAKYVDGFLIVVKAHRTPRGALAQTLDLVDPAKVTGLVFNGDNTRRSGYYDAYVASPRGARWRLPWSKP